MRKVGWAHRAHLAVGLGNEYVRRQLGEQGLVDFVEGLAGMKTLADALIDVQARTSDVEGWMTDFG